MFRFKLNLLYNGKQKDYKKKKKIPQACQVCPEKSENYLEITEVVCGISSKMPQKTKFWMNQTLSEHLMFHI